MWVCHPSLLICVSVCTQPIVATQLKQILLFFFKSIFTLISPHCSFSYFAWATFTGSVVSIQWHMVINMQKQASLLLSKKKNDCSQKFGLSVRRGPLLSSFVAAKVHTLLGRLSTVEHRASVRGIQPRLNGECFLWSEAQLWWTVKAF